jgi:hypothetical protein
MPHAFDSVCRMTRFGYSSSSDRKPGWPAKSIYASSRITMPLKRRMTFSISFFGKQLPDGLFGEQRNSSRVFSSAAANNFSASSVKPGSNCTSRICTSLIAAATLYMP